MESWNRKPATREDFPIASLKIGESVHVAGWAKGAVFKLVEINGSTATIRTRKSNKEFRVPTGKLLGLKQ